MAFVLGAYPSALHVRWRQPRWLVDEAPVSGAIGNLAVDVEPTVFWDGDGAADLMNEWKRASGFREGDERGEWEHVTTGSSNGSSGRAVKADILAPLRIEERGVWFSDVEPYYLVKRGRRGKKREQGDAIDEDYAPLVASDANLLPAEIPAWLDIDEIAGWGLMHRRDALRREILESEAELVITLGEAARRVVAGVADVASGGVCVRLEEKMTGYGEPGRLEIGARSMRWLALIHPGQNKPGWKEQRRRWIDRLR